MISLISVEKKAYDLLPRGADTLPPIDIDAIIREQNVWVREDATLHSDIIGKIGFEKDRAIISISPQNNVYEARRRFTLAHELGHYLLHAVEKKEFVDRTEEMYRSGSISRFEAEANHFAACLLMPAKALVNSVSDKINYFNDNPDLFSKDEFIRLLAFDYQVSMQSMTFRLRKLGILTN